MTSHVSSPVDQKMTSVRLSTNANRPLDQMINKTVLIQIIAFLRRHIQNLRRLDLARSAFAAINCVFWLKWRTLSAVIFFASATGTTSSDVVINRLGLSTILKIAVSPSSTTVSHVLIHYLVQNPVLLLQRIVSCLNDLKQILKIPVILQVLR